MATNRDQLTHSVYERIKAMILDNSIVPGAKVNMDALSRELEVSQTPVREALQRLEGDKLVVAGRPRGYFATPLLTEPELEHMFEVRLLLEPWAAKVAAADRAANPGAAMVAEIERFQKLEFNPETWKHDLAYHDTQFHELALRATGNDFLLRAHRQMHPHLHLFRLYPDDPGGSSTVDEHLRIADAIGDGQPEAAESGMREHLIVALRRYLESARFDERAGERTSSQLSGEDDVDRPITEVRSSVLSAE